MKIQFLGQNCFLFTHNGKTILSDPFFNHQKSQTGFDIAAQKIDYVLITHAHGDHIADVKEVLQHHPETTVIGQPEICGYFNHSNSIDINIGGSAKIDDLKITMVRADHTSSFPDGSYGGVASGYLFRYEEKVVYLAGDTAPFSEMKLFSKLFGDITAAILPIGAHYTMCARQASYAAAKLLKTPFVIGCHFDTFPPIAIDHDWAKRQFAERNTDFTLPTLGEVFDI